MYPFTINLILEFFNVSDYINLIAHFELNSFCFIEHVREV